ncbi:MAG: hypothetical protein NT051_00895 [Candidatus Micrarchaeota archaeon]|nr:hypothetical protein [Candidatus Micrarchaeota archaeon]
MMIPIVPITYLYPSLFKQGGSSGSLALSVRKAKSEFSAPLCFPGEFKQAKKNTGMSRKSLVEFRKEFRRFSKGKSNRYNEMCADFVSKTAAHLKIELSEEQAQAAKLDISESSKQMLRDANDVRRASILSYVIGAASTPVLPAIIIPLLVKFANDAEYVSAHKPIFVLAGVAFGLIDFFVGKGISNAYLRHASGSYGDYLLETAYNARAAVMDAFSPKSFWESGKSKKQ